MNAQSKQPDQSSNEILRHFSSRNMNENGGAKKLRCLFFTQFRNRILDGFLFLNNFEPIDWEISNGSGLYREHR